MKKIAVIGLACVDIVASPVNDYPEMGSIFPTDSIKQFVGGNAANSSIDFCRLGVGKDISLCCHLGDDPLGHFVIQELKNHGVDTQYAAMDPSVDTTVSIVYINTQVNDRYAVLCPSSAYAFRSADIPAQMIDESDIVFVTGHMMLGKFDYECNEFLKACQEKGKFTVLDVMWDLQGKWMEKIEKALPYIDLFMPSYDECRYMTGTEDIREMLRVFREKGSKDIVIKWGKRGVVIAKYGEEPYIITPCENVEVLDTVGAGDAFCTGTLTGLAMGKDLEEAAKLGSAVSAYCIQGAGTYSGVRSLEETVAFLKDHPTQKLPLE
ncbi:carbohydrate kinase family protein [Zongyangia hominis]|uniref:Carbohydrate kinase family protein n=1 Tax=Zongyangia hominis TaxID=2763677 RepID=A0A926EBR5_9FIRM|nr:carbohydrate kinase family protein [Zongyangia hominis]MBC8570883.1 carbohydrate kinase family protein [Zongyangia hominis]